MTTAKATTDHDEIKKWVEERGGTPANEFAFVRQDQTSDGKVSRFNKLVAHDTVKRRKAGEHGASAHER